MDYVKQRRTIRKYQKRDIEPNLLNTLLDTSARASTMGNLQLYSVIVTRDPDMKAKLAPAHFNQPMVTQAPVLLTFCADFRRTSIWCEHRKAEPGYDNLRKPAKDAKSCKRCESCNRYKRGTGLPDQRSGSPAAHYE